MAPFKGIEPLVELGPSFVVWQDRVGAYVKSSNAAAHAVMTAASSLPEVDVTLGTQPDPAVAGRVSASVASTRERVLAADSEAASALRLFMAPALALRYSHYVSGKALWVHLADEQAVLERETAPVKDGDLRRISPHPAETVATYCARALQLHLEVERLGRPMNQETLRDLVFDALVAARPAWTVSIETIQAQDFVKLARLVPKLTGLEVRNAALAAEVQQHGAFVDAAFSADMHPQGAAPHAALLSRIASLEMAARRGGHALSPSPDVADLTRRIAALEGQRQAASTGPDFTALASRVAGMERQRAGVNRRPRRLNSLGQPLPPPNETCYGCGSPDHVHANCPHREHQRESRLLSCSAACTSGGSTGEWVLDSGCSKHMSPGECAGVVFCNYRRLRSPQAVRFGKRGSTAHAVGIGDVLIQGHVGELTLEGVLHVPQLAGNLFSVSTAVGHAVAVHFDPAQRLGDEHCVSLLWQGRVILNASLRAGMYWLDVGHHACAAHADALAHEQAWLWHRRLGHAGFDTLADMARRQMLGGCNVTPEEFLQARTSHVCEPCVLGKLRRNPHPLRKQRATRILARLHADVLYFPITAAGRSHARYVATLKDEASGYSRITLIAVKGEAAGAMRNMIAWFERQTDRRVQRIRHDRGGEYINASLLSFYADRGIQVEPTAPYCPESNGVAERLNGVLLAKTRPMLAESGLGQRRWGDALCHANDMLNCTLSRGAKATPHERLLGSAPDVSGFRVFGCRAWGHSPNLPSRSKLAPRAIPGRFIGFEPPLGSGVYRLLLDDGRVMLSRTVIFDETPPAPATRPLPIALPRGWGEAEVPAISSREPLSVAPTPGVIGESAAALNPGVTATAEGSALPAIEESAVAPTLGAGDPPSAAPNPGVGALTGGSTSVSARQSGGAPVVGAVERPSVRGVSAEAYFQAPGGAAPSNEAPAAPARDAADTSAAVQPQTHGGRARRCNAGAPPERFGFVARLHPIAEEGRRWRRRDRRRKHRRASALPPLQPALLSPQPQLRGVGALQDDGERGAERELETAAAAAALPAFDEPNPRTVAEALARPDGAEWQRAIDEEVASCLHFGVWSDCDLPPGKQALPSRFVLERKRCGRYKARLVAGGHRQQQGLDFDETFAPVCSYRTLRMLLAVAAREDLELRQFDIKTAFLNGELHEEVYIRQPHGAQLGRDGRVLRLHRALYGLRQASRAWNKRLEAELQGRGFVQSDSDPSLWILHGKGGVVLAMFYVDDGLVAARTATQADALVAMVGDMFEIRVMGEPTDFVGISIVRDRAARRITIHQTDKARALATAAGVGGKQQDSPMTPETFAGLHAAVSGEPMADVERYQSLVGSLLHLAQCTRPDIALAVGAMAAYLHAPSQGHMDAVEAIVAYVGCTAQRGITYGTSSQVVQVFCDSNFASCVDTRRSITGYCVVMYGGAVSWASKKQPTTAASTMEAEYQACGAVAREGLSLLKALDDVALLSADLPIGEPLRVFCDNQAALCLLRDRKEGQRVKHIDIIHHFARDRVASGELVFVYCRSEDNISDCFTKALSKSALERCLLGLGVWG